MIVFLTLAYVVVLLILVKIGVLRWTLPVKVSPLLWMLLLFLVLFIPMQFSAPTGPVVVFQHSVQIVSNVAGQVIEVPVEPNQPLHKGDVLFRIDPLPYRAVVDQVRAQLKLAHIRLDQAETLVRQSAARQAEVEQYEAQVEQLEAQLEGAEYNLKETTVRAPADGFVTNLALRPGSRVAPLPLAPAMAFIESERVIGAQIHQIYLRHIEPGQQVEIAFKLYPGHTFSATVEQIVPATSLGQGAPAGLAITPREIVPAPFIVRLQLDADPALPELPAGAVGQAAIYTQQGRATHVIRRVMIRMQSWMNYVVPA